jgi:hypothetical protein
MNPRTTLLRHAGTPCGSGKKYKRCCLAKDAEAQTQALAAAPVPPAHDHLGFCDDCYPELATASNAVVNLVERRQARRGAAGRRCAAATLPRCA